MSHGLSQQNNRFSQETCGDGVDRSPWTGTSRQHQGSTVRFLREVSWKQLDTRVQRKDEDDDLENG